MWATFAYHWTASYHIPHASKKKTCIYSICNIFLIANCNIIVSLGVEHCFARLQVNIIYPNSPYDLYCVSSAIVLCVQRIQEMNGRRFVFGKSLWQQPRRHFFKLSQRSALHFFVKTVELWCHQPPWERRGVFPGPQWILEFFQLRDYWVYLLRRTVQIVFIECYSLVNRLLALCTA